MFPLDPNAPRRDRQAPVKDPAAPRPQQLTYRMNRYTVVTPRVTNAGHASDYPETFRTALLANGVTGWTEYETTGYWHGKFEPGVLFEVYNGDSTGNFAAKLGKLARRVMPDQDAVQVTFDPTRVELREY
jgi:hypothetical protein